MAMENEPLISDFPGYKPPFIRSFRCHVWLPEGIGTTPIGMYYQIEVLYIYWLGKHNIIGLMCIYIYMPIHISIYTYIHIFIYIYIYIYKYLYIYIYIYLDLYIYVYIYIYISNMSFSTYPARMQNRGIDSSCLFPSLGWSFDSIASIFSQAQAVDPVDMYEVQVRRRWPQNRKKIMNHGHRNSEFSQ